MAIPKLSLRAVLISTSVLFAAVILKLFVPTIIQFASSEVVLTWLRPPYLYLVINCIIITIVASSKLQNNKGVEDSSPEAVVVLQAPVKVEAGYAAGVYDGVGGKSDAVEVPPVFGYGYGEVVVKGEDFGVGGEVDGGGYAAGVYDGVDGKSDAVEVPPVFGYGYGEVVVKGEDFGVGGEVDGDGYAAVVYDGVDGKSDAVDVPPVFGYGYGEVVVKGEDFGVGGEVDGGMGEVESDKTTTLDLNAAEDVSGQDEVAVSTSLSSPQVNSATEYLVSSNERPPVSGRIGHRKGVRSSPEGGRTLGVSKPKRHETLENTWKTITEGRPMPLARHLRKSDTWETHNRVGHLQEEVHDQMMIKSETFNDRSTASPMKRPPVRLLREPSGSETFNDWSTAIPVNRPPVRLLREPSGSGKLKKESSPSQDELNRRVEAFIKKFNEEMRLQRQESLNKYKKMINRGAH